MVWKTCSNCGKETEMHSKDMCTTCYKKLMWKPRFAKCTRCQEEKILHAKGFCGGCYNFVFHLDKTKENNIKKWYGIDYRTYQKITKKCAVCDFNKIVDLHHLDENKKNNSDKNLIGLCPNHHKTLHDFRYRKEMRQFLEEKGIKVPIDKKLDFEMR